MVTELLVEDRIDHGHQLLIELVRAGFEVSAAAWVQRSEAGRWTLYIGSSALGAGQTGDIYTTLYDSLQRHPESGIGPSDVLLIPDSHPIACEAMAIRDRRSSGRAAVRYVGEQLGDLQIHSAYIYPRITSGLTRDETIQVITSLLTRADAFYPSTVTVTLRDGTVMRGIPYGLEMSRKFGRPASLDVKIQNDDGSDRVVPLDEVANIQ